MKRVNVTEVIALAVTWLVLAVLLAAGLSKWFRIQRDADAKDEEEKAAARNGKGIGERNRNGGS